jgi:hypothetical protein
LFLPVAGVSEVGTSTIVHRSPYQENGPFLHPWRLASDLRQLLEMFSKTIDRTRHQSNGISVIRQFLESLQSKEVVSKLSAEFISHENVLGWALNKIKRGPKLDVLFNRLVASTYSLQHLEAFYPPAIDSCPFQVQGCMFSSD